MRNVWRQSDREFNCIICFTGYYSNRKLYASYEHYAYLVGKWPPILLATTFVGSLTLAVVGYLTHDLYVGAVDVTQWYHLYILQTPYNRGTIHGYIVSYIHETVTVTCLAVNLSSYLSIFIAPILFLEAFCVNLLENITQLDALNVQRLPNDEQNAFTARLIVDSIEFHNAII